MGTFGVLFFFLTLLQLEKVLGGETVKVQLTPGKLL